MTNRYRRMTEMTRLIVNSKRVLANWRQLRNQRVKLCSNIICSRKIFVDFFRVCCKLCHLCQWKYKEREQNFKLLHLNFKLLLMNHYSNNSKLQLLSISTYYITHAGIFVSLHLAIAFIRLQNDYSRIKIYIHMQIRSSTAIKYFNNMIKPFER